VLRDQFLAIAAHELKNPLTTMLGTIQLLQRRFGRAGLLDARTERTVTILRVQGQRLNRLLDTLLDVGRLNLGQLHLEPVSLDLGVLTTRIIEEVQHLGEHVLITLTLPPDPCVIMGDTLRLEQVVINLVQNAVKYRRWANHGNGRLCRRPGVGSGAG